MRERSSAGRDTHHATLATRECRYGTCLAIYGGDEQAGRERSDSAPPQPRPRCDVAVFDDQLIAMDGNNTAGELPCASATRLNSGCSVRSVCGTSAAIAGG